MAIIESIKRVKILSKELENHPCCFEYSWDNLNRLTIIFPYGYYYGIAQGIRINETTKSKGLRKAIEKLEEVWKENL